ncbi:TetR-like C-terminal domain-containing protein [Actinocorallia sp. A-T 12471]|uniref:TetR-like C-terminal domain-containing protein n=1 Tax=Actinocorallia sp. A-T 12471 TaxID=3089813 RepID=UPI0029CEF8D6|nr:TetR-like C-terminal domain-containing protein [Actinocorallia sp. A-T 12471]MDX6742920.1 TetR-like C-terminal domain-containing protein [Actinocorallia sp. A-T 12471]
MLYRRWSTPEELLLAALGDPVVGFGEFVAPDTGSLRGDLLFLLGRLARILDEPRGRALHPLMTQFSTPPELYARVKELVIDPNHKIVMDCLHAAVARGEADPAAATPLVASVGPRLLFSEARDRATLTQGTVESIVDEVLLPLTAPRA